MVNHARQHTASARGTCFRTISCIGRWESIVPAKCRVLLEANPGTIKWPLAMKAGTMDEPFWYWPQNPIEPRRHLYLPGFNGPDSASSCRSIIPVIEEEGRIRRTLAGEGFKTKEVVSLDTIHETGKTVDQRTWTNGLKITFLDLVFAVFPIKQD